MSTEAETIADLARKGSESRVVALADGRQFLVAPQGFDIREVSDEHGRAITLPRYVKQSPTLQSADSLVDYVNRFKQPESLLFADIMANRIVALLDYHAPANTRAEPPAARHVAHKAAMALPFSEEWRVWTEISGKLKPQLEFARFIEENGADIAAPAGAELLEVVRDLQANRRVNFIKAVRTASDNENFEFTDETNVASRSKGGIEVPTKFLLKIPVYFGEPDTELYAFLRWSLVEGEGLKLGVALHRAEHVRQAVFKQIVLNIADLTGCPAVFGKAE